MKNYMSMSINALKTTRDIGYNVIATLSITVAALAMWMMAATGIDLSDNATQRPEMIAGALIIACMVMVCSFLKTHEIQRWGIARVVWCIGQTLVLCAFVIMSLIQIQIATLDTAVILPTHLQFIDYAFSYSIIAMMGIMGLIIIDSLICVMDSIYTVCTGVDDCLIDSYNRDDLLVCVFGAVALILLYRYSVYAG